MLESFLGSLRDSRQNVSANPAVRIPSNGIFSPQPVLIVAVAVGGTTWSFAICLSTQPVPSFKGVSNSTVSAAPPISSSVSASPSRFGGGRKLIVAVPSPLFTNAILKLVPLAG